MSGLTSKIILFSSQDWKMFSILKHHIKELPDTDIFVTTSFLG